MLSREWRLVFNPDCFPEEWPSLGDYSVANVMATKLELKWKVLKTGRKNRQMLPIPGDFLRVPQAASAIDVSVNGVAFLCSSADGCAFTATAPPEI